MVMARRGGADWPERGHRRPAGRHAWTPGPRAVTVLTESNHEYAFSHTAMADGGQRPQRDDGAYEPGGNMATDRGLSSRLTGLAAVPPGGYRGPRPGDRPARRPGGGRG